jgi:chromosome segregation ATPase
MAARKTAGRPVSYDPEIPGKCVEIIEERGVEVTTAAVGNLMSTEFGVSPGRPETLERQIRSYLDQREADRNAARIVKLPANVTWQIDQHADKIRAELLRHAGLQHEMIETEVRQEVDAAQADLKSHRAIIVKLEARVDELTGERDVARTESESSAKEIARLQYALARTRTENGRLKEP